MEPEAVAGNIRAKIAAGRLPAPPDPPEKRWPGPGEATVSPATGATSRSRATQIEYEVDPPGQPNDTVSRAVPDGLVRSASPRHTLAGGVSSLYPMAPPLRCRRWHGRCVYCRKPIAPEDSKVTIQGETYHAGCWERKSRRR